MIQIGNTLVSVEIIKENFKCDITKCKGACCVLGDSGAPLEEYELGILNEIFPEVKPYLRHEGIKAIEEQGTYVIDMDNEYVTPLIDNKECAYTNFKNGIAKCAIELAFNDRKISFQKPVSCCLYPVRIKKYNNFYAVNVDKWDICEPARKQGKKINMPVYKFVEDALVCKYGQNWFRELRKIASDMLKT